MNLLITGLPGVGKGTQSDLIVEQYNVKHLSTGNLFRNEIAKKSELGHELSSYMEKGMLVPDELTIKILKEELLSGEYENGFLLDGFPRTIKQAEYLDQMLSDSNLKLDRVIALELDEEIIIKRLVNRLFCSQCQTTFHKIFAKPTVEGVCDKCGGELIQREDDRIESITKRLSVANEQTVPVIEYYQQQNIVDYIKMEENDSELVVFEMIKSVLE
jgi:adenylate kinase